MSEHEMKMFAEIFGEQKKDDSAVSVEPSKTENAPNDSSVEKKEVVTKAEEPKAERPSEPDDGEEPEPFPKKDLGAGGASFADEILRRATPEILAKLKSGEKTMSGCWNWVYSFVRNEYIRQNGRNSGGMWMDVGNLITRYFDEIPEGTVCEEEKPKIVPPPPAPAVESDKKIVKKVAKRAAKAAKKAAKEKNGKESNSSAVDEEHKVPASKQISMESAFAKLFPGMNMSGSGK